MKLDDYLTRRQITFEQLSGEFATQALTRLQIDFILQAIIEAAKLKADQKDIDESLNRITEEKHREEHRNDPEYINYISTMIVRKKATEHLLSL